MKKYPIILLSIALVLLLTLSACSGDELPDATEETTTMDMEGSDSEEPMDMDMQEEMPTIMTDMEIMHENLMITNVWGRPGFEGDTGAVYLTIMNNGDSAERLISVQTDAANMTEIHEMKMENDVMMMQQAEGGLEIPAGDHISLAPGGYHVMMMGLKQDLNAGDTLSVLLEFENSGSLSLDVEIIQP